MAARWVIRWCTRGDSIRLAAGDRGRGLSFRLAPTYGAASSGVDRLWSARDARGLAPEGAFEPAADEQEKVEGGEWRQAHRRLARA